MQRSPRCRAAIAVGFGLLAAFILLAQRFDPLTAGLALAGLFLATAAITGLTALLIRRRTIAHAQREPAARRTFDSRLLAVGLAKEWAAHSSRDTSPPQ
jgi:hypothetical protein